MKIDMPGRRKWPEQQAAVIGDAPSVHMHIRELVRSYGWRIDAPPYAVHRCDDIIATGAAYLFIIDDSPTLSAYECIRTITSNPAGRLTPILAMLSETTLEDKLIFQKVLRVGVATRPLTPSIFLPSFKALITQWEQPDFVTLRRCGYGIMNGQATAIIPILKKLSETSGVASYALQALMKILCNNHEFREAETILIRILKSNSRDPAILATCAQFYQDALMPAQALRFLQKLTLICNSSPIFAFDFAAAYMALGDLAEATRVLLEWNARHPGNERVAAYLARLLIAEGREDEIERRVLLNKTAAKRLLDVWENVENPSTQASA